MRIRLATLGDMQELLRIEDECFAQERFEQELLEALVTSSLFRSFVAEDEDGTLGSAMVYLGPHMEEAHILSIAVLPSARGKGVGKALAQRLEREAIAAGAELMSLEVRSDNVSAHKLYISLGYEDRGIIDSYFGPGEDAIFMVKRLPPA
jgi:ribosomal protein S18 acetylase RimI-like enzyme